MSPPPELSRTLVGAGRMARLDALGPHCIIPARSGEKAERVRSSRIEHGIASMTSNSQISEVTLNANGELPEDQVGNRPLDDVLTIIEKREILAALHLAGGQRTRAARLLSISRSRLYRRMEALGIEPKTPGSGAGA